MRTSFFKNKPIDSHRVCVVFDPKNGQVVHFHGTTNPSISEGELIERAMMHAKHLGHDIAGKKAMAVAHAEVREPGTYRVTGAKLELVRRAEPVRAVQLASRTK